MLLRVRSRFCYGRRSGEDMVKTLIEMWFSLKKYGRWHDVAQHLLRAEHELLSAFVVVFRSLKDAAAPYAKDDPLASLLMEVFTFFERAMTVLQPTAREVNNPEAVKETQRRALLAIRDVLLDERAAVVPDALETKQRSSVIDAILSVIDRELVHLNAADVQDEEPAVDQPEPAPAGDISEDVSSIEAH
jgi:hypothetical protein